MTKSDLKKMTLFAEAIYKLISHIPKGKTMTYRQVAETVGKPGASRAVGNMLNKNHDKSIPCHRVIRSDGTSGGYAWGTEKKRTMLKQEEAI